MLLETYPHTRPRHERAFRYARYLLLREPMRLLGLSYVERAFPLFKKISRAIAATPNASATKHLKMAKDIFLQNMTNGEANVVTVSRMVTKIVMQAVEEKCRPIAQRLINKTFFELQLQRQEEDLIHEVMIDLLKSYQRDPKSLRTKIHQLYTIVFRKACWMTGKDHREMARDELDWNIDKKAASLDSMEIGCESDDDREHDLQQDEDAMLEVVLDELIDIVDDFYPDDTDAERVERTFLLRAKLQGFADSITAKLFRNRVQPNTLAARRRRMIEELMVIAEELWQTGSEERWVMVLHNRVLQEHRDQTTPSKNDESLAS